MDRNVDRMQEWPEDARRDRLIGDWHLYQRTGGHRTSTDDLITAWYAVHRSRKTPQHYVDLGCGVGSVLLMVGHKLQPGLSLGIEAQKQSVSLTERTLSELPPGSGKLTVEHADFRDVGFIERKFELVTGSPPYFPVDAGVLPSDEQRRACRFEVRGGVESYFEAAARAMTQSARFYLVFQTQWNQRVMNAAENARLHLTGRADFTMTLSQPRPFLTVYEFVKTPREQMHQFACTIRQSNGEFTPQYRSLRVELGVLS